MFPASAGVKIKSKIPDFERGKAIPLKRDQPEEYIEYFEDWSRPEGSQKGAFCKGLIMGQPDTAPSSTVRIFLKDIWRRYFESTSDLPWVPRHILEF